MGVCSSIFSRLSGLSPHGTSIMPSMLRASVLIIYSPAQVTFILKRIEQYHGVAVPLGFKDDFTGDRSEIRLSIQDQQPDRRVGLLVRKLYKNTRLVIDAFGFVHYPLDGFRADAILFSACRSTPRNSRNRNSSASGNTFQVILWTHSRINFTKDKRIIWNYKYFYPCRSTIV